MQTLAIEKRIWYFDVKPTALASTEPFDDEDEDLDGDLGDDLEDDEAEAEIEELAGLDDDEGDLDDDESFRVQVITDMTTTLERAIELFNASRESLGVGPQDEILGVVLGTTAFQLPSAATLGASTHH